MNQDTPKGFRQHIGIFGRRNVGKSSLLNALTRQKTAIVSAVPGTTTDPIEKPMELLPIGPVLFIDTAGIDDIGALGALRIQKTFQILDRTDLGILVVDVSRAISTSHVLPILSKSTSSKSAVPFQTQGWGDYEERMVDELTKRKTPFFVVLNKIDLAPPSSSLREYLASQKIPYVETSTLSPDFSQPASDSSSGSNVTDASCPPAIHSSSVCSPPVYQLANCPPAESSTGTSHPLSNPILSDNTTPDGKIIPGVSCVRDMLVQILPDDFLTPPPIVSDLVPPHEWVVLVVPIDKEAPKGRLILPQVQTIRDLLDGDQGCLVVKENLLESALKRLNPPPKLVVTDSQAFKEVAKIVPDAIPLTSFSVLLARQKGDLKTLAAGASAIGQLTSNARILVAESCSHHPIAEDIGTEKIPRWLRQRLGDTIEIGHVQGHDFPVTSQELARWDLVIHCGACMWNRREMLRRLSRCLEAGVPITNYGLAIAYLHGIFDRALQPFEASFQKRS